MQLIPGSDNTYRFNYWGYSTTAFFAPMTRYSQAAADGRHGREVVREFKTLVRECHKRGLEVILDVVFNHTAEGNECGPTISFRCARGDSFSGGVQQKLMLQTHIYGWYVLVCAAAHHFVVFHLCCRVSDNLQACYILVALASRASHNCHYHPCCCLLQQSAACMALDSCRVCSQALIVAGATLTTPLMACVLPYCPSCDFACRGLDNRVYYMLAPEGQYYNYSGCGNVVNCNHPVVRRFIVDCLRYWVQVGAHCSFLVDTVLLCSR